MTGTDNLAIVMPVYNEAENVAAVLDEWRPVLETEGCHFRFIMVNDGSTDGTSAILDELAADGTGGIQVIHQDNAGHGAACRRGYEHAVIGDYEWVLQIDSDGQCDPAYLSDLWRKRRGVDCVFGVRIRRDDGVVRVIVSRVCGALVSAISWRRIIDPNSPYRLMRREILERALLKIPNAIELQNIALAMALYSDRTLRRVEIPILFRPRSAGENSINLAGIARMAIRFLGQAARLRR